MPETADIAQFSFVFISISALLFACEKVWYCSFSVSGYDSVLKSVLDHEQVPPLSTGEGAIVHPPTRWCILVSWLR